MRTRYSQHERIEAPCDCNDCAARSVFHFEHLDASAFTEDQSEFAEVVFDGFLSMLEAAETPRFSVAKLRYLANWIAAKQPPTDVVESLRVTHDQQGFLQYMLERTDDTFRPVEYCQWDLQAHLTEYLGHFRECITEMAVEVARQEGRVH